MKKDYEVFKIRESRLLFSQKRILVYKLLPGITLTSGLAIVAIFLQTLPGIGIFNSLTLAILLGILVRNTVGTPNICQFGVSFSLKRILKLAIILLGLKLSWVQLFEIGSIGFFIVISTLMSTFLFTCWLGKHLGISKKLSQLIAAGTSICGASAVVATNAAIDGNDEDVTYAVAIVTVFGTTSMLIYPTLSEFFHLSSQAFGIWCGTSIHEVAQVIATTFQKGEPSSQIATISKLSRVIFLAPIVSILGVLSVRSTAQRQQVTLQQAPIPWFILCFIILILINSLNIIPEGIKGFLINSNNFLLTIPMVAMGLETNVYRLKKAGLKPLYLGFLSWLFISIFSFMIVNLFYS